MKNEEKENVCVTCDEICSYLTNEVKPGDSVRLSIGRVYIPGKVVTNNEGILQIDVAGDIIKGLTCVDVEELKDYLIEVEHECKGKICVLEAKNE